jgi:hypothetical protein
VHTAVNCHARSKITYFVQKYNKKRKGKNKKGKKYNKKGKK